ncbi:hypothetical protein JT305_02895 [Salmonella enterica subsp. enterica serovar Senftenberg]|nr:hypothetical protein [Salmonella enterica subsp. enterica serovar Senftenberg]
MAMDDAVRLNSCAAAAQVYIGSEHEHQSIKNIIQLIDAGLRVGMPIMAVTGVGKDMARDQRYFHWQRVSLRKWGRKLSKRIMSIKVLSVLRQVVRCRLSSPAVKTA